MNENMLKNYANLIIKRGVNLQKGQELVISCDVENSGFARLLNDVAYECGASKVNIKWDDEYITRSFLVNSDEKKLKTIPSWFSGFYDYYDSSGACYVKAISDDPDLLSGVSQKRVKDYTHAKNKALVNHDKNIMGNFVRWNVCAVPSKKWAKKVFPDLCESDAVENLWHCILEASRADGDNPLEAWDKHIESFKRKIDFLQKNKFKYLHYTNAIGTDIIVELPRNNMWVGGNELGRDGVSFSANIPSEEVYTTPKNSGTKGTVAASLPLVYNGVVIEGIKLTFENGKVSDYSAATNAEALKGILEADEGSKMLGEVALVESGSPISKMNVLFYETLFDENASCHFALGKGYPCIENYESMSDSELCGAGINDSILHVDFMVGTPDLRITGIKENGERVTVFLDGNFAY